MATLYDSASQCFINRDFRGAAAQLGEAEQQPSLKLWMLYFALCERALIEPNSEEWPIADASRKKLQQSVINSTLWTDLEKCYTPDKVPAVLVTTAMMLASKHKADGAPIVSFMENYLDEDVGLEVVDLFVDSVLLNLVHDFYYAKELVRGPLYSQDAEKQESLLATISKTEVAYAEALRKETDALRMQEQQRIFEAIQRSRTSDLGKPETDEEEDDTTVEEDEMELKQVERVPKRQYQRLQLTTVWRQWLHDLVRSQGIYNALLLIIVLLGVARSQNARRTLQQGMRWLYRAARIGLEMALRVTYL